MWQKGLIRATEFYNFTMTLNSTILHDCNCFVLFYLFPIWRFMHHPLTNSTGISILGPGSGFFFVSFFKALLLLYYHCYFGKTQIDFFVERDKSPKKKKNMFFNVFKDYNIIFPNTASLLFKGLVLLHSLKFSSQSIDG